ncbi:DegV family protein [Intestinibacter sp.]|uniref:DegV family protein n=1 Tax=Intestinibacter sp. TaxID=1965304 RepID=UPI003F14DFAB
MIRIITDSSSDITREEAQRLGVELVALHVSFGEESFLDGVNITHDEFYKRLEEAEELPKTSQMNPAGFVEVFEKFIDNGDEIVGIFLSSKLSGTYQSAVIASQMIETDKIHIVDSKNASLGLAVLVREAVKLRDAGKTAEEITSEIEELVKRVKLVAVMDTLKYLKMGGRLSATSALVGGVLGITPVISVIDGGVEVLAKTRGHKKSIKFMVDYMQENTPDQNYCVDFGYTRIIKNLDDFKASCKPNFELGEEATREIGAVIGTHVGPGAFGVAYIGK